MFQCLPSPLATSSLPPPPPLLRTMAILHPVHGVVLAPPAPPPPPQIFAAIPQVLLALFIFSFRPFGCRLLSDGKGKGDTEGSAQTEREAADQRKHVYSIQSTADANFQGREAHAGAAGAFATFIPFPFLCPEARAFFRLSICLRRGIR